MKDSTPSKPSAHATGFDPEEFQRLIKVGLSRGLIKSGSGDAEKALVIDKVGLDLATVGRVRTQLMDVTPAMAERWLKNNFRNRPMREDTVIAYARDMKNGVWVLTHQGIAFNDQDHLIDGQHRLRAIILSGCTVSMMVTFGLPSKIDGKEATTMDAVDRGATRSIGDQLTIQHGLKNGGIIAAICASLAGICCGERTRRLSVGQTLEVYREFQPAVDYIVEHRSTQVGLRSTGVMAGFAFALLPDMKFPEPRVKSMFHQVITGEGMESGAIPGVLRAFLTSEEAKLFTRSLDRGLAELVLQAIFLYQAGTRRKRLQPSLEGVEYYRRAQPARVSKIAAIFKLPK
jgi:hypothetical protein